MTPGEYFTKDGEVLCNAGRSVTEIIVTNKGDRPIQVGSHCHFFEINRQMRFDRVKAFGMRLNIPAGTAVRFEAGEEKKVALVSFGGARRIFGINNLVDGDTVLDRSKTAAMERMERNHFENEPS